MHSSNLEELKEFTSTLFEKFYHSYSLGIENAVGRVLYELEDDLDDTLSKYVIYSELYQLIKKEDNELAEKIYNVVDSLRPMVQEEYNNLFLVKTGLV
ncbi:hypothetical protein P4797_20715 [Priestia aryabhattai]|uniref:hypothetical protein n=1 Tax=Priestia aryabhattai TaxID=412384 RepID=UPI002E1E55A3|nr:hypothetical protein [Priestia aryabhattai]